MKKSLQTLAAMAAVICGFVLVSCSEDKDPDTTVINHIYLQVPDGNATIVAGTDATIEVQVRLSQTVAENTSFTFAVDGDEDGVFVITNNPVVIKAGEAEGFFTVAPAAGAVVPEDVTAKFTITNLDPSKFDIAQNLTIKMLAAQSSGDLDPEIAALVEAWKTSYGVDLAPWIGNVKLEGEIEFPGDGFLDPFVSPTTYTLSGYTKFAISQESTEEMPVLDMIENPMGMTDYLYTTLRQLTVEDYEYFANEDEEYSIGGPIMKLIGWNADSQESFTVTLPGIKITDIANGKATLEFVEEGENYILNSKGEPIYSELLEDYLLHNYATSWIPFQYDFTAWNRQLGLVEDGNEEAIELTGTLSTADPQFYLGTEDVLEDYYEGEDDILNYYVYPSGVIDFNAGTITFEFPFCHYDQYGYSRVKVTYTLN
ncbi:MAG: DUF4929 family protein [Muribaculaceae bacterium]|nr:DUF4929 family protein [Muribaculaceae bacterium]